ncbi:MAG: hypothetical protein AWT59_1790 [Candidatus Gallionella acididurans]|uniref:Uncharacterized protein n=1 Tax=Candidatus Gallionella acididurans TaxID=1796491 RepID=A0A139BT16_9PROT|nr:MAG: hypothetical protein AWT59_1790 [Candidatus Gallionella acididurans]
MIILLVVMSCEICATDTLRLQQGATRANDNPRRENVKLFLSSLRVRTEENYSMVIEEIRPPGK